MAETYVETTSGGVVVAGVVVGVEVIGVIVEVVEGVGMMGMGTFEGFFGWQ